MRTRITLILTALFVACVFSTRARAEAENTSEYRAQLATEKKYPEALKAFREASAKDPKNPILLFNVGLMAYLAGKPKESIEPWLKVKELEPKNWRVRTKLIQAYEAAGQTKERDAERAAFFKFRSATTDPQLKDLKFYTRDQFAVGDTHLMVFEYFELEGEEPIRYSFDILPKEGKHVKDRYTLGSYEVTNAIAHETGDLKKDVRLFHLDAYFDDGRKHETHGMFEGEPTYDSIKTAVQDILQGKRRAMSSSTVNKP